jgi:hypothetical protein
LPLCRILKNIFTKQRQIKRGNPFNLLLTS